MYAHFATLRLNLTVLLMFFYTIKIACFQRYSMELALFNYSLGCNHFTCSFRTLKK